MRGILSVSRQFGISGAGLDQTPVPFSRVNLVTELGNREVLIKGRIHTCLTYNMFI